MWLGDLKISADLAGENIVNLSVSGHGGDLHKAARETGSFIVSSPSRSGSASPRLPSKDQPNGLPKVFAGFFQSRALGVRSGQVLHPGDISFRHLFEHGGKFDVYSPSMPT